MKLHELGAQRPQEQVAKVFESRLGDRVDFDRISPAQAQRMLSKVRALVREHRAGPNRHFSERNPDYLRLIMLEQALTVHVKEQATIATGQSTTGQVGAVVTDPKAKAVMDKVQRGQSLTPDEQKTVNKIALTKETKKSKRMVRESEINTAQVVLAAQDMVDQVQKMLEQISAMQFKDLPALTDSIKNDMGVEQATQFQADATAALTQLLTSLQTGKTQLEAAQGVLTGQAPTVPGAEPAADLGAIPPAGEEGDVDADLSLDANLPGDEEEELGGAALGRERR
jgi:hypothetical protein